MVDVDGGRFLLLLLQKNLPPRKLAASCEVLTYCRNEEGEEPWETLEPPRRRPLRCLAAFETRAPISGEGVPLHIESAARSSSPFFHHSHHTYTGRLPSYIGAAPPAQSVLLACD